MEKKNERVSLKIVLYQPEIPANTGNIGRLCVGSNTELHIIRPMRFMITDKHVKRAGLDYWDDLNLVIHDSFDDFMNKFSDHNIYYCTTKSKQKYTDLKYTNKDIFMFGPESRGIPEEILNANKNNCITIPMSDKIRSINLSNSVAIILFEALRQTNFNF